MIPKLLTKSRLQNHRNVCRLCLSSGPLREIIGTKLPNMIEACLDVKVSNHESRNICVDCFRQVVRFYTYKQKVRRYQTTLEKFLGCIKNGIEAKRFDGEKKTEKINKTDLVEVEPVAEIQLEDIKIVNFNIDPPPLVPIKSLTENIKPTLDKVELPPPLIPLPSITKLSNKTNTDNHKLLCNICKQTFYKQKELITHLKRHKKSKRFLCSMCGKGYSSPSTYKIHIRTHTGERPFKCIICSKSFIRRAGLTTHMAVHGKHQPYKCKTCGKDFKISSNLYRHERLHTGIFNFCCNYCKKTFSQDEHLQIHIRVHHTKEKPYLCSECGISFVTSQRLKRHMWTHTEMKPYPCVLCSKAYANLSDLKNHMLKIHKNKAALQEESIQNQIN